MERQREEQEPAVELAEPLGRRVESVDEGRKDVHAAAELEHATPGTGPPLRGCPPVPCDLALTHM